MGGVMGKFGGTKVRGVAGSGLVKFLREKAWPLLFLLWVVLNGPFPNSAYNTRKRELGLLDL